MKALRRILLVVIVLFIALQFVRPTKNTATDEPNHISTQYPLPSDVQTVLKAACTDCHSNNTRYPWYAEIQPIGWLLDGHVRDGKRSLNLSEFTTYRARRQFHKLEEIGDMVYENKMPLSEYIMLHPEAKLTEEQKRVLIDWTEALRDSMKARYPADSLMAGQ